MRKRTQAKQRSEAVAGAAGAAALPAPVPVEKRSQIVSNIRKNSMLGGPVAGGVGMGAYGAAAGAPSGYGPPGPSGYAPLGYGAGLPQTSSPPSMGRPTCLPQVDEQGYSGRRPSGPPGSVPPPRRVSAPRRLCTPASKRPAAAVPARGPLQPRRPRVGRLLARAVAAPPATTGCGDAAAASTGRTGLVGGRPSAPTAERA